MSVKKAIELLEEIKEAAGKTPKDIFYYLHADQAIAELENVEDTPKHIAPYKKKMDELIEQYMKKKTRIDLFFDWLNNLPVTLRLLIVIAIIFTACFFGYLIRLVIKLWR